MIADLKLDSAMRQSGSTVEDDRRRGGLLGEVVGGAH